MTLSEMIYHRKTTRSFEETEISPEILSKIEIFGNEIKPLFPHINTDFRIIGSSSVKNILPWKTPHYVAIFSEEKEEFALNIGFIFQQLDLYIQSLGMGGCWLGMGKFSPQGDKENQLFAHSSGLSNIGMEFVIMIGVGCPKSKSLRELSDFKRKGLEEISDWADERLEPARLAPSGKNAQPWFFTHDDNTFHCYYAPKGIFKKTEKPNKINQIDIGCALAHMYVANPKTFQFHVYPKPPNENGFSYIGSFQI